MQKKNARKKLKSKKYFKDFLVFVQIKRALRRQSWLAKTRRRRTKKHTKIITTTKKPLTTTTTKKYSVIFVVPSKH